jgi:hypothetical protein
MQAALVQTAVIMDTVDIALSDSDIRVSLAPWCGACAWVAGFSIWRLGVVPVHGLSDSRPNKPSHFFLTLIRSCFLFSPTS